MSVYYNENDKFNIEWLRHLIGVGVIAPGEIDGRDIREVGAADLRGFTQCHFFAGIGVWSYALRQAGWEDSKRVWTGSCPCQPFSVSGKRGGASDERHLWPEFFRLIREQNTVTVLGEQVASDDGLAWLDLVSSDLEGQGYTVGAVDTPACGFGAPHRRQRLYWMAHSAERGRHDGRGMHRGRTEIGQGIETSIGSELRLETERDGAIERLADSSGRRCEQWDESERSIQLSDADGDMGQSSITRLEGHFGNGDHGNEPGRERTDPPGSTAPPSILNGFWESAEWLWCRDEKYRPVEAGTFPLAHGITGRVGLLRGYGNALCAPQAKAFIKAVMDVA